MAYDQATKRFCERYKRAEGLRRQVATVLDEAYEFCMPLRQRLYAKSARPQVDRLFDGTAVDSLERFASRTFDDIWPLEQKPFDLEPGPAARVNDVDGAKRQLSMLADAIILGVNNSRFRSAGIEAFRDFGVGTGIMMVEAGDAAEPLRFSSVPLSEAVLDVGPWGATEAMWREREMPVGHVQAMYPGARLPQAWAHMLRDKPETKVKLLEGVERDRWDTPPGEERWIFRVVPHGGADGVEEIIAQNEWTGPGACPFLAFSYSRVAGEIMGRGPAMLALPDIRTANKLKEMLLEHADLALSGIWLADDDGIINPDTAIIQPGEIIPRAPGSKGLEPVKLPPGPDFGYVELEKLQENIRRFFHINDLGPLAQTPRSATEVMQRTADSARSLAGAYGNLLQDFLFPLVRRVLWIAKRQGAVPILPPLDGAQIAIRPLAPLTRAMAQDNILRHIRFMEVSAQFFGPQALATHVNIEKFMPWLASQTGFDPNLLRTKPERDKLVADVAAMAQQAQAAGVQMP